MTTIRVNVRGIERVARLGDDLAALPAKIHADGAAAVRQGVELGEYVSRQRARRMGGPHGSNFFKRISSEMTGALEGEWGPEGPPKSRYVGVEDSAGAMRDVEAGADPAADLTQEKLREAMGGWFW